MKNIPFFKHLLGLALLSQMNLSFCDDDTSEEDFFNLLPIVLSASRLLQPINETPSSLTVIDRSLIDATGASNVVELFRLVPGFQVAYVRGHFYSVSYHGLADRYARDMQVLINGRSVYNPAYGGVPWSNLPLEIDNIDRIEVIRGPNAATYGSNAFAGVINIITKLPADGKGGVLKVIAGNHGREVSGGFSGIYQDFSARLSLNKKINDGLNKAFDNYNQQNIDFNGIYTFGDGNSLDFSIGFSRGDYDDGFADDLIQPFRETQRRYGYQQLLFKKQININTEYQWRFYHNYLHVDDNVVVTDSPFPFDLAAGYGFTTHRYDLEFQHIFKLGDDFRMVWGLGARYDKMDSFFTINPTKVNRHQTRGFFNIEQQLISDMLINLGLMVENFEGKKILFSPKVGVNFHLNQQQTIRMSFSQAYRVPTLYEDNAELMLFIDQKEAGYLPFNRIQKTRGHLKPSRIQALELGYIGSFSELNLAIDGKLYYEKITDRMTTGTDRNFTDPIPVEGLNEGAIMITNDSNAKRKGIELAVKWQPIQQWFARMTYEFNRISGFGIRRILAPDETHTRPFRDLSLYAPIHSLSLLTQYQFTEHFSLAGAWYYSGQTRWAGEGDRVESSDRFDINASQSFKTNDYEGKITLAIKNITNQHYADFYNQAADFRINVWDRRMELQLGLHF